MRSSATNTNDDGRADRVPEPSAWLFRLFGGYARRYVGRHFHALRLSGPVPSDGDRPGPVIVYLNHASWWDPLTCLVLASQLFPGRRHYAPIDAAALARYRFFARLGFFGIEKGTRRGAAQFLRASLEVLSRPRAALWITAEGDFRDPRRRPVQLRPGLAHLLRRLGEGTVLPVAIEYPFWQERTPEALVRFGEPIEVASHSSRTVDEWRAALEHELERSLDLLAADAVRQDAAAFGTRIAGRAGVGGVYEMWQRAAAAVRRQPFRAEHGAVE